MVKRQRRVLDKLLVGADLLCEPVPGVPLVEIMNDQRILIENHHGVTSYGRNEIRVKVRYGEISVCGEKLELACITGKQLVITGRIENVSLFRGTHK